MPGVAAASPVRGPGSCPTPAAEPSVPARYADPFAAVPALDKLRKEHPGCVELDLAAAREGAAAGILDSSRDGKLAWLQGAVSAARAALADDSSRADTHYWLAATLGLVADNAPGRAKIVAAREAWKQAERTLAIDPMNAGAHHIIGRLHAGVERLPWVQKLIARALGLGAVLRTASWKSAEDELRLAARLDPESLVDQVELAKLLRDRGRVAEGDSILRDVAARTPRNPLDAYYVNEAGELLGEG
jgi:hypothetical protein